MQVWCRALQMFNLSLFDYAYVVVDYVLFKKFKQLSANFFKYQSMHLWIKMST